MRQQSIRPEPEDQAWYPLRGPALYLFDNDAVNLVRDVVEPVGNLLQMIVDLRADDEIHRIGIAMLEEKLLQADVVEIVDPALQLGHFLGDRSQHRDIATDRLQQRQRTADETGAFDQECCYLAHRRFETSDLEQNDRLRGLLHLVNRVIHRRDQVLDIDAVERRDEGSADRGEHFA